MEKQKGTGKKNLERGFMYLCMMHPVAKIFISVMSYSSLQGTLTLAKTGSY